MRNGHQELKLDYSFPLSAKFNTLRSVQGQIHYFKRVFTTVKQNGNLNSWKFCAYKCFHTFFGTARYWFLQLTCISVQFLDSLLSNQLPLYLFRQLSMPKWGALSSWVAPFFSFCLQFVKIILNSNTVLQSKFWCSLPSSSHLGAFSASDMPISVLLPRKTTQYILNLTASSFLSKYFQSIFAQCWAFSSRLLFFGFPMRVACSGIRQTGHPFLHN